MSNVNRGYTLIEVMVALAVFAVMTVLATNGLYSVIQNRDILNQKNQILASQQIAIALISKDMAQIIDRPIIDASGQKQKSFLGNNQYLEFTRTGFQNPLGLKQSSLQRVAYFWNEKGLQRKTWQVLDPVEVNENETQLLIPGAQEVTWRYVNFQQKKLSNWPPLPDAKTQEEPAPTFPDAVVLAIKLPNWGKLELLFPIKAKSLYGQDANTP